MTGRPVAAGVRIRQTAVSDSRRPRASATLSRRHAMALSRAFERRRANRLETPSCPRCVTLTTVRGVVRTEFVIYFRCDACGQTWPLPRPGAPSGDDPPSADRES